MITHIYEDSRKLGMKFSQEEANYLSYELCEPSYFYSKENTANFYFDLEAINTELCVRNKMNRCVYIAMAKKARL